MILILVAFAVPVEGEILWSLWSKNIDVEPLDQTVVLSQIACTCLLKSNVK